MAVSEDAYSQLNQWAQEPFEYSRDNATTTPAFTGFSASVGPQEVMCSIVESVFNANYSTTLPFGPGQLLSAKQIVTIATLPPLQ